MEKTSRTESSPPSPAAVELARPGVVAPRCCSSCSPRAGICSCRCSGGGRPLRLPARVRPRRAAPARRSLPLDQRRGLGLPAPRPGRRAAGRAPCRALRVPRRGAALDRAIALEEASARDAHHEESLLAARPRRWASSSPRASSGTFVGRAVRVSSRVLPGTARCRRAISGAASPSLAPSSLGAF